MANECPEIILLSSDEEPSPQVDSSQKANVTSRKTTARKSICISKTNTSVPSGSNLKSISSICDRIKTETSDLKTNSSPISQHLKFSKEVNAKRKQSTIDKASFQKMPRLRARKTINSPLVKEFSQVDTPIIDKHSSLSKRSSVKDDTKWRILNNKSNMPTFRSNSTAINSGNQINISVGQKKSDLIYNSSSINSMFSHSSTNKVSVIPIPDTQQFSKSSVINESKPSISIIKLEDKNSNCPRKARKSLKNSKPVVPESLMLSLSKGGVSITNISPNITNDNLSNHTGSSSVNDCYKKITIENNYLSTPLDSSSHNLSMQNKRYKNESRQSNNLSDNTDKSVLSITKTIPKAKVVHTLPKTSSFQPHKNSEILITSIPVGRRLKASPVQSSQTHSVPVLPDIPRTNESDCAESLPTRMKNQTMCENKQIESLPKIKRNKTCTSTDTNKKIPNVTLPLTNSILPNVASKSTYAKNQERISSLKKSLNKLKVNKLLQGKNTVPTLVGAESLKVTNSEENLSTDAEMKSGTIQRKDILSSKESLGNKLKENSCLKTQENVKGNDQTSKQNPSSKQVTSPKLSLKRKINNVSEDDHSRKKSKVDCISLNMSSVSPFADHLQPSSPPNGIVEKEVLGESSDCNKTHYEKVKSPENSLEKEVNNINGEDHSLKKGEDECVTLNQPSTSDLADHHHQSFQPNGIVEGQAPWESSDDNLTKFKKLLESCVPVLKKREDYKSGEEVKISKRLLKSFQSANPVYSMSSEFNELLLSTFNNIKDVPENIYLHLNEVKNILVAYKHKESKVQPTPLKSPISFNTSEKSNCSPSLQIESERTSFETTTVSSEPGPSGIKDVIPTVKLENINIPAHANTVPVSTINESRQSNPNSQSDSFEQDLEKRIKSLERYLKLLDRKIQKFLARDVSLDEMDDDETPYIQEDRYKRKFLKVWEKLCSLKKCSTRFGREIDKRFVYKGTRFDPVNRAIEKFINKRKPCDRFPNYVEILDLIEKVNDVQQLGMNKGLIEKTAKDVFSDIGIELKNRRIKDYNMDFGCHLTDNISMEDDPAERDQNLRNVLADSISVGEKKIAEIIERYATKEIEGLDDENIVGDVCETSMEEVKENDEDLPDTDPADQNSDDETKPLTPPTCSVNNDVKEDNFVIDIGASSDVSTEPDISEISSKNLFTEPKIFTDSPVIIDDEIEIVEGPSLSMDDDFYSSPELPCLSDLLR